mmetsp:Transcript_10839/g.25682  ORF Transcript_10839/g.25682 Transcript_10839/m.25682 type:complete len:224 (+) Transcript_10839:1928-2599(+)
MGRKFLRAPLKLDVGKVHSCSLPDLKQIFSNNFDFIQISSHFVVHEGKPIGYPKNKSGICSGKRAFVHIHSLKDTLSNVHATTGFEPIVQVESCRMVRSTALCQDQTPEFVWTLAFLAYRKNSVVVCLHFGGPFALRFFFLFLTPTGFLLACSGIDFQIAHFFGWDPFALFGGHGCAGCWDLPYSSRYRCDIFAEKKLESFGFQIFVALGETAAILPNAERRT